MSYKWKWLAFFKKRACAHPLSYLFLLKYSAKPDSPNHVIKTLHFRCTSCDKVVAKNYRTIDAKTARFLNKHLSDMEKTVFFGWDKKEPTDFQGITNIEKRKEAIESAANEITQAIIPTDPKTGRVL